MLSAVMICYFSIMIFVQSYLKLGDDGAHTGLNHMRAGPFW